MARGNQRDKAREANQKKLAAESAKQKSGNKMTGTQMAADKEKVAAKMREKQAAADAKKAAEAAAKK